MGKKLGLFFHLRWWRIIPNGRRGGLAVELDQFESFLTVLMKMRVNRRQKELDRWERIVGSLGFHYTSLYSEEGKKFCVCESTDDMLRYSRCVSCSHADDNNIHERQRVWDTHNFFWGGIFTLFLFLRKYCETWISSTQQQQQRGSDKNARSNSNQSFSSRLSGTQQRVNEIVHKLRRIFDASRTQYIEQIFFSHIFYVYGSDPIEWNTHNNFHWILTLNSFGTSTYPRLSHVCSILVAKISDHRETF